MSSLERELRRGTLELLLLRILAEEPTYGYELLSRLADRTEGRLGIKEGTLYPVLYRLEDAGLVTPEWEQPARESGRGAPRKIYRLTESGERRVEELTAAWRSFAAAVESVLDRPASPEGKKDKEKDS